MNTSPFDSPVPWTRGWDLPEEILHAIMSSIELREEDEYGQRDARTRAKHALVAPSLVNKYWSATIRPLLFRLLWLRNLKDALFLQDVVRNPAFVAAAIEEIHVWYINPPAVPWAYHVHWLMHRLPHASVVWYGRHLSGSRAPTPAQLNPFAALRRIPPSSLRLTLLDLDGAHFASSTALVRLVDSFPALQHCLCCRLSFGDPAPYVPPRWRQRQCSRRRPLNSCCIAGTKGMALAVQTLLASDILRAAARLGLDDGVWRTVLEAAVALVPDTWEQITLELQDQDGLRFGRAAIGFSEISAPSVTSGMVGIYVRQPGAGSPSPEGPFPRRIWRIALIGSLPGMHTNGPTPLDVLHSDNHEAVANLEDVFIWARPSDKDDRAGMTKIMCAVLRRSQLSWALGARRLRFGQHLDTGGWHILNSAHILSVPTERIVSGTSVTLGIPEQAEWLLRFEPKARHAYLRQLAAQRRTVPVAIAVPANRECAEDDEKQVQ